MPTKFVIASFYRYTSILSNPDTTEELRNSVNAGKVYYDEALKNLDKLEGMCNKPGIRSALSAAVEEQDLRNADPFK